MENLKYQRGDAFYIEGTMNGTGSEQAYTRPGIIVSNNMGNQYSKTVEIVYLTTAHKKPLPTHVNVMCEKPSIALCESVFTVDKTRLGTYIGTCTKDEMEQINEALLISLGLN